MHIKNYTMGSITCLNCKALKVLFPKGWRNTILEYQNVNQNCKASYHMLFVTSNPRMSIRIPHKSTNINPEQLCTLSKHASLGRIFHRPCIATKYWPSGAAAASPFTTCSYKLSGRSQAKTVMMYHLSEHRSSLLPEKTELKFRSLPYTRLQFVRCKCVASESFSTPQEVSSTLKPFHRLDSSITYKVLCKSTFSNKICFRPHASKEMPLFPVELGNTICWPLSMLPASL
jgi:hypothetical protein